MKESSETARRFRAELVAREDAATREIAAAYEEAWKEFQTEIERVVSAVFEVEIASRQPALLRADKLPALLFLFNANVDSLTETATRIAREAQLDVIRMAQRHARRLAGSSGEAAETNEILTAEEIEALADTTFDGAGLQEYFAQYGERIKQRAEKIISAVIASGVGREQSAKQIAAEMRSQMDAATSGAPPQTVKTLRSALRLMLVYRYRAVSHAYFAEQSNFAAWIWTSGRAITTCKFCWALDGLRFPIDEPMQSHPHCRCVMRPVSAENVVTDTGETAFAKLPSARQAEILGKDYAQFKNNPGLKLSDLVKNKYRPSSSYQLRAFEQLLANMPDKISAGDVTATIRLNGFITEDYDPADDEFTFSSLRRGGPSAETDGLGQRHQNSNALNAKGSGAADVITLTVTVKSYEALTAAILAHYGFSAEDEARFRARYTADLRQELIKAGKQSDTPKNPILGGLKDIGNGRFQIVINLLPSKLLDRIHEYKKWKRDNVTPITPGNAYGLIRKGKPKRKLTPDEEKEYWEYQLLKKHAEEAGLFTTPIGEPAHTYDIRRFTVVGRIVEGYDEEQNALSALIYHLYGDRAIFGGGRAEILRRSQARGVKLLKFESDGAVVHIELTLISLLILQSEYIKVQLETNEVVRKAREAAEQNPFSQFFTGVYDGGVGSITGLYELGKLILSPSEIGNAIEGVINLLRELSTENIAAIYEQLKTEDYRELAEKAVNGIPYAAGYVIGMLVTEFFIGKGVSAVLKLLSKLPALRKLSLALTELRNKGLTKTAEFFGDERAALATQRLLHPSRMKLYAGLPAELAMEYVLFAGNAILRGVRKFSEFSKEMIAKFGDKVRPHLERLYREQMTEQKLFNEFDEAGIKTAKSKGELIDKSATSGSKTEDPKTGTALPKSVYLEKVEKWEKEGKITGELERLKKDLASPNINIRRAAEGEVVELERKIGKNEIPEVRGSRKGTDQPEYEVKTRTEPFIDLNNAQNWFNNRIKEANKQFIGQKATGRVIINLGKEKNIGQIPLTETVVRDFVRNALAKGGRGTNITEVIVKMLDGRVIYKGLGD